ncbi:UDP-glucose/GDP-mannose dehydrogenase family protein [bacterium]|nr:MAG: UDP-glucose/GDP-mannose dehydrogenase family protein [bacterium]
MRHIAVVGTGYVGLVTGTCLAELGNKVVCIDSDARKVDALEQGRLPFFEPGLLELVLRNQHGGRLSFAREVAEGTRGSEVIFIAVGTPMADDGHADLRHVREVAMQIARSLDSPKVVVNKSTVPVETGDLVASIIREHKTSDYDVHVVSNPEFLREGSAIADFMKPDRIVLGVETPVAEGLMRALYAPLEAPIIVTDVRTAEMIKYTANAFLATKISFINEIAAICEHVGADVKDVVIGAGSDRRIGAAFMNPGLGFGGSCFPKDVMALQCIAEGHGLKPRILDAVLTVNERQIERACTKITEALGNLKDRRVGLLGLAFKPNTDDVRESPAIALAERLIAGGATVAAHDPVAIETARERLGDRVLYMNDYYESANDAEALVIATDWNEYKQVDFSMLRKLMKGRFIFDMRNIYDPSDAEAQGFVYVGVGRPRNGVIDKESATRANLAEEHHS